MKIRVLDSTPVAQAQTQGNGLYATRNHLPLLSRILLSAIFIWSGINKILYAGPTQDYMTAYGMPAVQMFWLAAIVIEIGAGLSLLLGYKARIGAAALIAFTLIASFIFHTDFSDQIQQIMFMKNLAIIGGLLMVIQHGPGNVAIRG